VPPAAEQEAFVPPAAEQEAFVPPAAEQEAFAPAAAGSAGVAAGLSFPQPTSAPTSIPEAAEIARVFPIFMVIPPMGRLRAPVIFDASSDAADAAGEGPSTELRVRRESVSAYRVIATFFLR